MINVINVIQFITFLYESKIDMANGNEMSHQTALPLLLMFILQISQGKIILKLEETHISIYTDKNLL